MSWLTVLRYGVPAAIAAFLIWATIDRFNQAAKVDRHERCEKAAGTADKPTGDCTAAIAARIAAARRALECEAAIGRRDLYAIRATCGAQAKRAVAQLDAAESSLASVQQDLKTERATRADAIARAEMRATTLANRTADNDRTIKAAPRTDDGRVRCDAECVRRLAGDLDPQR
jgi:hypothetical protein